MLMHDPVTLHRCQRYEKVIGVTPPHVPSVVVSVESTAGVPVITGTALFDGAPVGDRRRRRRAAAAAGAAAAEEACRTTGS